jgi:hypothetical protein
MAISSVNIKGISAFIPKKIGGMKQNLLGGMKSVKMLLFVWAKLDEFSGMRISFTHARYEAAF